jgi:hypothetical protein
LAVVSIDAGAILYAEHNSLMMADITVCAIDRCCCEDEVFTLRLMLPHPPPPPFSSSVCSTQHTRWQ